MKRIFIVDDASDIGRYLRGLLQTWDAGAAVQVFLSAEEAILEASRQAVDLLVTDIRLPGISGFELVEKVRVYRPAVKVILISGLADERLTQKLRQAQVDAFLRKPFGAEDFLRAVEACLYSGQAGPAAGSKTAAPRVQRQQPLAGSTTETLTSILTDLQRRLGAQAALLLDGRGRILARAGVLPVPDFTQVWAPALTAALEAARGLSHLVGALQPGTLLMARGRRLELLLAPAGDELALALVLPEAQAVLRRAFAQEEMLQVQQQLSAALAGAGEEPLPAQPAAVAAGSAEPPLVNQELDEDSSAAHLAALLQQASVTGQDAHAFWEAQGEAAAGEAANPEMFTFEQARKLGLVPPELAEG